MQKDRLIALFAHIAANPEAEIELIAGLNTDVVDGIEDVVGYSIDVYDDWKPASSKPRVWSGRVLIDAGALNRVELPKWTDGATVDLVITEVLK